MKRILLDTNIYIDWLNLGAHEHWTIGGRFVRHASAVVLMELAVGAFTPQSQREIARLARTFSALGRLVEPSREAWLRAGVVLRQLHVRGRETRRASLVNDVLIALSAREVGATLVTRDVADHDAIRPLVGHSFLSAESAAH